MRSSPYITQKKIIFYTLSFLCITATWVSQASHVDKDTFSYRVCNQLRKPIQTAGSASGCAGVCKNGFSAVPQTNCCKSYKILPGECRTVYIHHGATMGLRGAHIGVNPLDEIFYLWKSCPKGMHCFEHDKTTCNRCDSKRLSYGHNSITYTVTPANAGTHDKPLTHAGPSNL